MPEVKQQQHRVIYVGRSYLWLLEWERSLPETHWPWRPASWDPDSRPGTAPDPAPLPPPLVPVASAAASGRRRLNLWPRLIGKAKN